MSSQGEAKDLRRVEVIENESGKEKELEADEGDSDAFRANKRDERDSVGCARETLY